MAALVTFPSTTEKQRRAASMKTKFSFNFIGLYQQWRNLCGKGPGSHLNLRIKWNPHGRKKKIVAGPPSCLKNEWVPTYSPLVHV